MPPKTDSSKMNASMGDKEREIANLRKLLEVKKQNITDITMKYGDLIKSKEAGFARTKADLL